MDNFFYNMNKKLKEVLDTPKSEHKQLNERDEGKHNNATTGFKALANKAAKEYGSKAAGERVAGAVRNKMKKAGKLEEGDMEESAFQAAIGKKKYGDEGMKALQKAGREHASAKTMSNIRNKYDKYDESMEEGMIDNLKAGVKKVAKKGLEKLGHGDDTAMRKDLQRKMGVPQTGKKPTSEGDFGPMEGEGGVPMTPKQKKFAKLAPPADKITFADKIAGAKKEVDEMLGDVAAEAIKGALSPKQKKLDRNHNGKIDAQDLAMLRASKGKQETDEGSDWSQLGKEYSRPKIGSVERGAKHDIEHTATGRKVTRRTDDQGISVGADDDTPAAGEKRGRGRPKGSGKSIGAKGPSGTSKLMKREGSSEENPNVAKAKAILKKAGYTVSKDGEEELDEKAVSKKQQRFMGMVHATQKGEKAPSKEVAKVAKSMKKKDAEDFAKTKHKGLPEKAPKKKEESAGEDKPKKVKEQGGADTPTASSGFGYGKGIYDSINRELEQMIAESMSINASDSTEGGKSLTITATDEDALKLGALLKSAGLGGGEAAAEPGEVEVVGVESPISGDEHSHDDGECPTCGSHDCGCGDIDEALAENEPDWPTDQETSDDPFQYSGGLNKPKSTGQTTVPVIAHQDSRMGVDGDEDLRRMMEMAGIESDLKPWEKTMKEEAEEGVEESEEELDEAKQCSACESTPCKCDESMAESLARIRGLAGIQEAAKPDYIDLDKDGDKEESMKKAAKDKEDKKVDESIARLTNLWKSYKE